MERETLATVALVSILLYGAVTLGGRTLLHRHDTDDSGWRGLSGRPGSAPWWGGVLMALAAAGLLVPPIVALALPGAAAHPARVIAGGVGFVLGLGYTLHAQLAMGRSWRVGVREGEDTELCTDGPFRGCRNPVFTGMLASLGSLVLWLPALIVPWFALLVALQIQVRLVEEPHLRALHGEAYRRYAAATGRFLPGLGRGL